MAWDVKSCSLRLAFLEEVHLVSGNAPVWRRLDSHKPTLASTHQPQEPWRVRWGRSSISPDLLLELLLELLLKLLLKLLLALQQCGQISGCSVGAVGCPDDVGYPRIRGSAAHTHAYFQPHSRSLLTIKRVVLS